MVRLDCFVERFLKSLVVVIRTSIKQLVRQFHRHALDRLEEIARKPFMFSAHQKSRAARLIRLTLVLTGARPKNAGN